jgi:hypothetical protein
MNRIAALALVASVGWTTAGAAKGAPPWVSWDAASKTVTFTLEAGAPSSSGPFNFDGYSNGKATLVVPAGSTVVMNFINHDGTPHSAELIPDQDPMPNMAGDPAIPAAYTKDVDQAAAGWNRRDPLHRSGQRDLSNLLRRSGPRPFRDVDPIQGGPRCPNAQPGHQLIQCECSSRGRNRGEQGEPYEARDHRTDGGTPVCEPRPGRPVPWG